MPELTFITCRTHILDEMEYMLSVYVGPNGHIGFWECDKCCGEGGTERRATSGEEAIARCIRAIERHHAKTHRSPQPAHTFAANVGRLGT
jgi:hypothetical protein